MNVLLVVPWDQEFGGVASVVGNLGRHLSNAGHHVVFFHPGESRRLRPKATAWGFSGYAAQHQDPAHHVPARAEPRGVHRLAVAHAVPAASADPSGADPSGQRALPDRGLLRLRHAAVAPADQARSRPFTALTCSPRAGSWGSTAGRFTSSSRPRTRSLCPRARSSRTSFAPSRRRPARRCSFTTASTSAS